MRCVPSNAKHALPFDSQLSQLQQEWRRIIQQLLPSLTSLSGEFGQDRSSMILIANKGEGDQPIHFDTLRWQSDAEKQCTITALLYCTPSSRSTLLPCFQSPLFFPQELEVGDSMAAHYPLLDKQYFHTEEVEAGTVLFFRHGVPHAGVACTTDSPRVVLFDLVSADWKRLDAERQYFYWNYAEAAWGFDSRQHAEAVYQHWKEVEKRLTKKQLTQYRRLLHRFNYYIV